MRPDSATCIQGLGRELVRAPPQRTRRPAHLRLVHLLAPATPLPRRCGWRIWPRPPWLQALRATRAWSTHRLRGTRHHGCVLYSGLTAGGQVLVDAISCDGVCGPCCAFVVAVCECAVRARGSELSVPTQLVEEGTHARHFYLPWEPRHGTSAKARPFVNMPKRGMQPRRSALRLGRPPEHFLMELRCFSLRVWPRTSRSATQRIRSRSGRSGARDICAAGCVRAFAHPRCICTYSTARASASDSSSGLRIWMLRRSRLRSTACKSRSALTASANSSCTTSATSCAITNRS